MNDLDPYAGSRYDPLTQHVLNMREAVQLPESAARLVAESAAMFEEAQQRTAGRPYSVARVVRAAIAGEASTALSARQARSSRTGPASRTAQTSRGFPGASSRRRCICRSARCSPAPERRAAISSRRALSTRWLR
jgi:hypothetical protein